MEQVKSCEECPYEEMCIETVKRGISVYCGGSLCVELLNKMEKTTE